MIDISEEAVDALCLRLVVNDDYDTLVAVQALRAALDEAEARARYAETDAGYLRAQSKELRAHWNQAEARATHWHDGWKRAMGEFDAKCKEANEQRARAEHWENVAIARDAKLRKAEGERDAAIAAARIAHDALWELNPNNYDHDEVCKVNNGSIDAILTLAPIIGETHGKPPEWWAERDAHSGAKP